MTATVLEGFPYQVNDAALLTRLRIQEGSRNASAALDMARQAETIARPRAMYAVAFVDRKADDYVVVEGVQLTSRVLRVNLEQVHRIFPYVATCGVELAEWYRGQQDLLHQFWAETIAELALSAAVVMLRQHLLTEYRLDGLSAMAPGALPDWPLEEQRQVFHLLGDTQRIGVLLTEALLMVPTKSVSGVFFPSEITFESCQLCARERCPGRRAAYDAQLFERNYRGLGEAEATA